MSKKKLNDAFVKALGATRGKSGKRLSAGAVEALGVSRPTNPNIPKQLDKIAIQLERLEKHMMHYSGIDAKHASRVARDADAIVTMAATISGYAEWIIQNPHDPDGATKYAAKKARKVRKALGY